MIKFFSDGELLIVDYSSRPFSPSAVLNSTFEGDHIEPPSESVKVHPLAISSQRLQSAIQNANLEDYSYRPAFLLNVENNTQIPFFIATGLKPNYK